MKLLKITILFMVMVVGGLFVLPTLQASELTTEPTTEITTEITTAVDNLSITDAWEQAKTWIVGSIISLFSGGTLAAVAYIILNKGKNKITAYLNQAADENKISRATADKLIDRTNDIANKVYNKVDNLETAMVDKLDDVTDKIMEVVDSQSAFFTELKDALIEYMED